MNVLYQCEECGGRFFAAPKYKGAVTRSLNCNRHPDAKIVQTEDYVGPNFAYINPKEGKDPGSGQTHVQTGSVKNITTVNVKPEKVEEDPNVIRDRLRKRYRTLYKEEADKRWGITKLRTLVAIREEEVEEATKQEFGDKKREAGEAE